MRELGAGRLGYGVCISPCATFAFSAVNYLTAMDTKKIPEFIGAYNQMQIKKSGYPNRHKKAAAAPRYHRFVKNVAIF